MDIFARNRRQLAAVVFAAACTVTVVPASATPFVEAHVLVGGAQITCFTGTPDTFNRNLTGVPVTAGSSFFAAGNEGGAGVPIPGFAACGGPGDANIDTKTAASGTVSDTTSLSYTLTQNGFVLSTSAGSAQGHADSGGPGVVPTVGAAAQMTVSATSSGLPGGPGSDAYGVTRQAITLFSPSLGAAGFVTVEIAVDGSMSDTGGNGTGRLRALYEQDDGSVHSLVTAQVDRATGNSLTCNANLGGSCTSGFTLGPGASIAGSGTFLTMEMPFDNSVPFDFTYGMLATASGVQVGATADVSFDTTAALEGFSVFNAQGAPVTDFTATLGSGAVYDANGIIPATTQGVPEPPDLSLLLPALVMLGLIRRQRPIDRGAGLPAGN